MEYVGRYNGDCKDSEKFQDQAGNGEEDEDGSVLRLKSAGPRGRHGYPERPSCKYPASNKYVQPPVTSDRQPLIKVFMRLLLNLVVYVSPGISPSAAAPEQSSE